MDEDDETEMLPLKLLKKSDEDQMLRLFKLLRKSNQVAYLRAQIPCDCFLSLVKADDGSSMHVVR